MDLRLSHLNCALCEYRGITFVKSVLLKAETYMTLMNFIGLPLVVVYVAFMFIKPWFYGDWAYVHDVWHTWQSLNVGVLAFVSSLIAFNISRYNAEQQRRRDYLAAKAFLPRSLSQLCSFMKASTKVYVNAASKSKKAEAPQEPLAELDVFKECIRHAQPDVGNYLAVILMKLQIHNSRMSEVSIRQRTNFIYCRDCIYDACEIQVLINYIFDHARGEKEYVEPTFSWDDYKTAYRNMDVRFENIDKLEEVTKSRIEKSGGKIFT